MKVRKSMCPIFEHNLENNLVELYGMIKNLKSSLYIMYKSGENANIDSEENELINSIALTMDYVNTMVERQDFIIKEFRENYM